MPESIQSSLAPSVSPSLMDGLFDNNVPVDIGPKHSLVLNKFKQIEIQLLL